MSSNHFCELCKSECIVFTEESYDMPATYKCRKCGLVQLRFDSAEDRHKWESYYIDNGRYHRERVLAGFLSYIDRFRHDRKLAIVRMENIVRFKQYGTLLDVGASNGALVAVANNYGFNAIGIEPDRWVVEKSPVKLFCTTFQEWVSTCNDSYDVITFIDSFEHMTNPKSILADVKRILKPDGLLVVEMPDADAKDGFDAQGIYWRHFKPLEHAFLYGNQHMRKLLTDFDFAIIDSIVPYPDRRIYYATEARP